VQFEQAAGEGFVFPIGGRRAARHGWQQVQHVAGSQGPGVLDVSAGQDAPHVRQRTQLGVLRFEQPLDGRHVHLAVGHVER
jgi:hypothetical protein